MAIVNERTHSQLLQDKSQPHQCLTEADANGIFKNSLNVLETNERAISLYKTYGFEAEEILKKEKLLSDENYYNTVVMGRFHD